MATVPANSNRKLTITPNDDGNTLEIGPAGTYQSVATFAVQFNPSIAFVGSFAVLGRVAGKAAQEASMPLVRLPYRRINVAGQASDWAFTSDLLTTAALIQVPSNGLSVALQVSCNQGNCDVSVLDLQGPGGV